MLNIEDFEEGKPIEIEVSEIPDGIAVDVDLNNEEPRLACIIHRYDDEVLMECYKTGETFRLDNNHKVSTGGEVNLSVIEQVVTYLERHPEQLDEVKLEEDENASVNLH